MENSRFKFRGMDLEGRWFYGLPCIIKDGRDKGTYISNKFGIPKAYDVRPETLSQFTGLLDKQGVEIYEGDILTRYFDNGQKESNMFVEYEDEDGAFRLNEYRLNPYTKETGLYGQLPCSIDIAQTWEIIGNIYEHDFLLDNNS